MAGNATITTQGSFGPVTTDIWMQSIQTSSDAEFDDNQVSAGMSFRPIRRSEMFVTFTAIWSLQRYADMDAFQEQINQHYQLIQYGDATPMQLYYIENELYYEGWIESVQKEYARFENVFVRNYRMNILLPNKTWKVAQAAETSGLVTKNYAKMFGNNWYNVSKADPIKINNPSPKFTQVKVYYRQTR